MNSASVGMGWDGMRRGSGRMVFSMKIKRSEETLKTNLQAFIIGAKRGS